MKILIKTVSWTLNQSYKWARTELSLRMYGLLFTINTRHSMGRLYVYCIYLEVSSTSVLKQKMFCSPTNRILLHPRVSHIWYDILECFEKFLIWSILSINFPRIVPKNVKLYRNLGNWWDKNHISSYWPLIGHTEESN